MDEHIVGQPEAESGDLAEIKGLLRELIQETKKLGRKQGRVVEMDSPWLSLRNAAQYCDYSEHHFRDLVQEYEIPRHGPHHNKFNKYDLDRWMEEPKCFKQPSQYRVGRRRTGEFRIQNLELRLASRQPGFEENGLDPSEWVYVGTVIEDAVPEE